MRKRLKRVFRNSLYNVGGWGLTVVIRLLVLPYYIHHLSVEGFGLYAILHSLIGYIDILDLGLAQGVTKYVAECEQKKEWRLLGKYVGNALLAMGILGVAAGGALWLARAPLVDLLIQKSEWYAVGDAALKLTALGIPFALLVMVGSATLKGMQRYDRVNKITMTVAVLSSLVGVLLLSLGYGVIALIALDLVTIGVTLIVMYVMVRYTLGHVPLRIRYDRAIFSELFSFGGYLVVLRVATRAGILLPRFVLAAVAGTASVTYYEVGAKVLTALQGMQNQAAHVLLPVASQLTIEDPTKERFKRSYLSGVTLVAVFSIPLYLTLAVFGYDLLYLWVGADVAKESALPLTLLASAFLASGYTAIPTYFAMGEGKTRLLAIFGIIYLVCTVLLIVPMTKAGSAVGAAGAVFVSRLLAATFLLWQYNRHLGLQGEHYVRRVIVYPASLAGLMVAVAYLISTAVGAVPLLALGIASISVCLYFLAVWRSSVLPSTMKREMVHMVRK
ncbi:oligosaccharide flippase family protein [Rhodocaloribacter sp.]